MCEQLDSEYSLPTIFAKTTHAVPESSFDPFSLKAYEDRRRLSMAPADLMLSPIQSALKLWQAGATILPWPRRTRDPWPR